MADPALVLGVPATERDQRQPRLSPLQRRCIAGCAVGIAEDTEGGQDGAALAAVTADGPGFDSWSHGFPVGRHVS